MNYRSQIKIMDRLVNEFRANLSFPKSHVWSVTDKDLKILDGGDGNTNNNNLWGSLLSLVGDWHKEVKPLPIEFAYCRIHEEVTGWKFEGPSSRGSITDNQIIETLKINRPVTAEMAREALGIAFKSLDPSALTLSPAQLTISRFVSDGNADSAADLSDNIDAKRVKKCKFAKNRFEPPNDQRLLRSVCRMYLYLSPTMEMLEAVNQLLESHSEEGDKLISTSLLLVHMRDLNHFTISEIPLQALVQESLNSQAISIFAKYGVCTPELLDSVFNDQFIIDLSNFISDEYPNTVTFVALDDELSRQLLPESRGRKRGISSEEQQRREKNIGSMPPPYGIQSMEEEGTDGTFPNHPNVGRKYFPYSWGLDRALKSWLEQLNAKLNETTKAKLSAHQEGVLKARSASSSEVCFLDLERQIIPLTDSLCLDIGAKTLYPSSKAVEIKYYSKMPFAVESFKLTLKTDPLEHASKYCDFGDPSPQQTQFVKINVEGLNERQIKKLVQFAEDSFFFKDLVWS